MGNGGEELQLPRHGNTPQGFSLCTSEGGPGAPRTVVLRRKIRKAARGADGPPWPYPPPPRRRPPPLSPPVFWPGCVADIVSLTSCRSCWVDCCCCCNCCSAVNCGWERTDWAWFTAAA